MVEHPKTKSTQPNPTHLTNLNATVEDDGVSGVGGDVSRVAHRVGGEGGGRWKGGQHQQPRGRRQH